MARWTIVLSGRIYIYRFVYVGRKTRTIRQKIVLSSEQCEASEGRCVSNPPGAGITLSGDYRRQAAAPEEGSDDGSRDHHGRANKRHQRSGSQCDDTRVGGLAERLAERVPMTVTITLNSTTPTLTLDESAGLQTAVPVDSGRASALP